MDRNRDETLRAEELDVFLTARLSGEKRARPLDVPLAEAILADELASLANTLWPAPAFVAELEARLSRRLLVHRLAARSRLARYIVTALPTRRGLSRVAIALGGLAVLALLFFIGFSLVFPRQGLNRLPTLDTLAGYAHSLYFTSGRVPSNLDFVLQTDLPASPRRARVFRQAESPAFTIEEARRWAERFGVRGQVYTPDPATNLYYVFDNPRGLLFGSAAMLYIDRSLTSLFNAMPSFLTFEQAAPIAEAFLREHGLLETSFRVEPCSLEGIGMVCFVDLIDGRPVRLAETDGGAFPPVPPNARIWAGVTASGPLIILYWPLTLKPGDTYPIRSAQEAWEMLRSAQDSQLIWYTAQSVTSGQTERTTRYWTPQYRPGQRADLYGTPMVYAPAEGQGPPLVEMNGLLLHNPPDDLLASLATQGYEWHIWGQVREDTPGAPMLEVTGWETSTYTVRYAFDGVIRQEGEQVLLRLDDGTVFFLPHAPAGQLDGLTVRVYGREMTRTQTTYPIMTWTYMESSLAAQPVYSRPVYSFQSYYPPAPRPSSHPQAFVEQIELMYYVVPVDAIARPTAGPDLRLVQPMWRFTGHTDRGTTFEALVQAVRDEYLKTR